MANLLEQAINSDDGDHAARIIQEALGIESDDVANYVFPLGELIDAALATQPITPTTTAPTRRQQFRVIQGGRED